MNVISVGLNEFNDALKCLNEKLVKAGIVIEIRAVGGYALLYNNLRKDGYTMDVDTLTESYSEKVTELIQEVSAEKGLDIDWINNDAYGLPEVMGIYKDITWLKSTEYSNIILCVANIESMLKMKVRAVHYGGLVPRITDQTDLLDILNSMGIHNIDELRKNDKTSNLEKEYPRCFAFLDGKQRW